MFDNIKNQFNGLFGKLAPDQCRLTMNGKIAVKCSNGYKTYNVEKGTLTNVSNFCFNIGEEMFFVIPTRKAKVGDILVIGGKPKCVTAVDKKTITVIDYENSEVRQVVPERHIFMGSTYFYGKVVSILGNSFGKSNGIKNMLKMLMMSQMLGGNSENSGLGISNMVAMSMMMGGNGNMFDNMFDFDMSDDDEEEGEDSDISEEKDEE